MSCFATGWISTAATSLPAPGAAGNVLRSTGSEWASAALDVANVTGAAPLASPALTGTPTAPTAAPGVATTQIASTEFVAAALTASSAFIELPAVDPIVIASSPAWTTTWTLDEAVPEGQTWRITYEVEFATRSLAGVVRGGSWVLTVVAARSIGGGATIVATGVSQTTGSFGSMGVQAIVTFATNKLSTQIRFAGGATGAIKHRYRRVVLTPTPV